MRAFSLTLAAAAAFALPSAVPAAPTAKAAARPNWLATVVDTGTGWRVGNPKAATALVEYGSFNCPHCAAFAKAAMPAIRKQVASGAMSFEFRPKQLFPHDPSATLLALCAGKEKALLFTDDYMANAPAVLDRLRADYAKDQAAFDKAEQGGGAAMARFYAERGQMGPIALRHGVSAQKANQCLGDAKLIARVEANENAARAAGVTGTPTFFINGKRADPSALEALGLPHVH